MVNSTWETSSGWTVATLLGRPRYPDGVERQWNDGRPDPTTRAYSEDIDDVGFISQLIDDIAVPISGPRDVRLGFDLDLRQGHAECGLLHLACRVLSRKPLRLFRRLDRATHLSAYGISCVPEMAVLADPIGALRTRGSLCGGARHLFI